MTLRELIRKCRYPSMEVSVDETIKRKSDPYYYKNISLCECGKTYALAGDILNKWSDDILNLEVTSFDVYGGLRGRLIVNVIRLDD